MEYYYSTNENEKNGPLSINELKQKNITSKTLIWHEKLDDWKMAGQLPELKSLFEKASSTAKKEESVREKINVDKKQVNEEMSAIKSSAYETIYCSSDDKYLLGLCGGLAHKFGVPVAVVRLVFLVASGFFIGWIYFAGVFLTKLPTKGVIKKPNKKQINEEMSTSKSGAYETIYCSSDDKFLLGLCGGLAHKFGIPVALVRLVFFVASWFFIGWIDFAGFFLTKLPTKNI